MGGQVTISIWLFLFLLAISILAVLDRILIPSSRWFLRRRINRVLEEIGTRLDIEIRPYLCRFHPGRNISPVLLRKIVAVHGVAMPHVRYILAQ